MRIDVELYRQNNILVYIPWDAGYRKCLLHSKAHRSRNGKTTEFIECMQCMVQENGNTASTTKISLHTILQMNI